MKSCHRAGGLGETQKHWVPLLSLLLGAGWVVNSVNLEGCENTTRSPGKDGCPFLWLSTHGRGCLEGRGGSSLQVTFLPPPSIGPHLNRHIPEMLSLSFKKG